MRGPEVLELGGSKLGRLLVQVVLLDHALREYQYHTLL